MSESLNVHEEDLEQVATEWSGLLACCDEQVPFATPAWQRMWLRHFQADRRLRILTVRDGERLLGVIPLLASETAAEFVGHYSICDYMDAVAQPGFEAPVLACALDRLKADGVTSLDLRGLREDSPTLSALEDACSRAGYVAAKEQEALSPRVLLPASWDEYLGLLSKKDRHEMRRKMRRLDSAGDVQMRVITTASDAEPLMEDLFRMMRLSNHHKEEFLDRPGMQDFFRDLTRTMADEGMLRLYSLTLDGVPVAMVHNLDLGGTLYMYNSGYDPAFSHYAVGLMSKALLIKDAIENGRKAVDFMRGDESYKYDLGGKDRVVYRVQLTA